MKAKDRRKGAVHATVLLYSILGTLVTGLAFGGWKARDWIENELASKVEVIVAGTKADYSLDIHMQRVIAEISRLEAKRKLTQEERDQVKFLRDDLERLRKIRSGK